MFLKIAKTFFVAGVVILSARLAPAASVAFEGTPGDGVSDFVYSAATGALSVDPDGSLVGVFQIRSDSGVFVGNNVQFPSGGLRTDTDVEIGWINVDASNAFTRALDLGNVALTGLTLDFLLQDLTRSRGSAGGFSPERPFGLIVINIPEPTSLTLFSLSLLGILGTLRRR